MAIREDILEDALVEVEKYALLDKEEAGGGCNIELVYLSGRVFGYEITVYSDNGMRKEFEIVTGVPDYQAIEQEYLGGLLGEIKRRREIRVKSETEEVKEVVEVKK